LSAFPSRKSWSKPIPIPQTNSLRHHPKRYIIPSAILIRSSIFITGRFSKAALLQLGEQPMSESDARYIFIESPRSRSSDTRKPLELTWAPAPREELPIETPVFAPVAAPVPAKKHRNLSPEQKRMRKLRAVVKQKFSERPAIKAYCRVVDAAHIELPPRLRDDPEGPHSYMQVIEKARFKHYRKNIEAEISNVWKSLRPHPHYAFA
jgi:hypothetical protein